MVSALGGPQTLKHIQAAKLKPLAYAGKERSPALPNVPTDIEQGFNPPVGNEIWQGVLAPKGTPRPIIDKLAAAFKKMTEVPKAVAMMKKFSDEFDYLGPEAFEKVWRSEYEAYKKLSQTFKK